MQSAVHSLEPRALREQALDLVIEITGAEIGCFYQLYDQDGKSHYDDVILRGAGASALDVSQMDGRPTPVGCAATPANTATRFRTDFNAATALRLHSLLLS